MKSPRRILTLILLLVAGGRAGALDAFNCLNDLLPITEKANYKAKRKGVEAPFAISSHYIVFPETDHGRLLGFYVYSDGEKAWYYDSANNTALSELKAQEPSPVVYELVAQPNGLETITLWMNEHSVRRPSSTPTEEPTHPILKLSTRKEKSQDALWEPIYRELDLRKEWIKNHNLNEDSFKVLSRVMDTSCSRL